MLQIVNLLRNFSAFWLFLRIKLAFSHLGLKPIASSFLVNNLYFIPFCSLLFLCSIQWFISNCSARQNILFFLQNQVIYTNLLIWTKAFLFLRDPVIYTIQLSEIKAFFFCKIQWLVPYCFIRQNFFFHGRFHLRIAFFFPFCM